MMTSQPAAQPRSPWVTVAIIAGVVIVLCALASCAVFLIVPAIMGSAVGNVLSNIVTSLPPTPTP